MGNATMENATRRARTTVDHGNASARHTLAVIAHDEKKVDILGWAQANAERLKRFRLVGTATTGTLLREKAGLEVETVLSGPQGGDVQIAAQVAEGKIHAVFFFMDPLHAHPHEPDIRAVMRVCNVHDIPFASNLATANLLIGAEDFMLARPRFAGPSKRSFMTKAAAILTAFVLCGTVGPRPATAADVKLSGALERVSLSGDFRVRDEHFENKSPGKLDRNRLRFRLRLATDFSFPHNLEAKFRFASGTGEQVSTNQSFDNLSAQKAFWIDRAYLQWSPLGFLRLAAGRMPNPFWTVYSSDVVWDDDVNPEGFSQSVEVLAPANARVFVNALQMVVDEDADTNEDQWMFGEQVGADLFLPLDLRVRLAVAYYNWGNVSTGTFGQPAANEGNQRTGASPGRLLNEFGVGEATGEVSAWVGPLPVSLQGTFIKNDKAKDVLLPKEDTGYQVGARLGKAAAAMSGEVAYFYKWVQTDATVADVADSDFGNGGTNRHGQIVWAAFNPTEWLQLKAKYFSTKVINEALPPKAGDINRFQFDLSLKF